MGRIFGFLIMALALFGISAEAQTALAYGTGVQDGTGALNTGGQWCFNSTCLSVTGGSFSGTVTPGTQTVTVKNASSVTVLTVPNVFIGTSPFNWNAYVIPPNTQVTGTGSVYLPCWVGSTYNSTVYCQSYQGQTSWGFTQSPASSGMQVGYGTPTFPCVSPCSFTRIDTQSIYAVVAPQGIASSAWVPQTGGPSLPVSIAQGGTSASTALAALAALSGLSLAQTAAQTLAGPLAGPGIVRNILADGASTALTDNSTAIQATVTAVQPTCGTVFIPRGTFQTQHTIIQGCATFAGEGVGSIVSFNPVCPCSPPTSEEAFRLGGSITTRRQIAAAVAAGATSFTLASSGDGTDLVQGEWLILEEYDAGALNQVISTWAQVLNVSGTTVNLVAPLKTAIPHLRTWSATAPLSGSSFYGITALVQGAKFRDMKIQVPTNGTVSATQLLAIYATEAVHTLTLDNVVIENAEGNAISTFLSSDVRINNSRIYASRQTQSITSGVSEIAATSGVSIKNSLFANYYSANATSPYSNYAGCLTLDNGTENFDITGNQFDNCSNIGLLLNTGVHNGTITNNHLGWIGGGSPGTAIEGISVQNVTVTGNTGTGGAGVGEIFETAGGYTVSVPSQGNNLFGNGWTGFSGGPFSGSSATANDFYMEQMGSGVWATNVGNMFASGINYGNSSATANGEFTLLDPSNNTILKNTGSGAIGFWMNTSYKMSLDSNGINTGDSATLGGLNSTIPKRITGDHGSSGTKIQLSDGSGATNDCPKYASDGSLTDSGIACTSGGGSLPAAPDTRDAVASNGSGTGSSILPAISEYNVVLNGGFDNTGTTDESSAAATLLTSGITEPIYFPPGTYNFNAGMHAIFTSSTGSGLNIRGAGIGQTIFQSTCSGGLPAWWFDYGTNNVTSGSYYHGPKLTGISLSDTSGTGACNSGVRLTQVANFHFYDIEPDNFKGKVYATGTVTVTNGSTSVTSSGATFTAAMVAGQAILHVAGRPQFVCGETSTTLTLCTPWQQSTASSTSYSLDYGGTGLLFDGGANYVQYGMVDGFWSQGDMVAIGSVPYASGSSGVGTSRIWIRGGFIDGGVPGSRLTDSKGAAFGGFTDTITWDIAVNNVAWGTFWENAHDNKIEGFVENNATVTPVTTCNGGVGTQSCIVGHEFTADATGRSYGNSVETDEVYLTGNALLVAATPASYISVSNPKWMNSGGASGNLNDFNFMGTTGCPANGSGNHATIVAWNCIHFTSTVGVN